MEFNGKLEYRALRDTDTAFVSMLAGESPDWAETELGESETAADFIRKYRGTGGEFRVWQVGGTDTALSYHIDKAESNRKPWLGTILVRRSARGKGIASAIVWKLASEWRTKGERATFCGVPADKMDWPLFLGKIGFEQLKIEQDENEKEFLVMVLPLDV
ncbi:hypothetical protein [Bacillus marinisedimentorum]|uniref:hypothetical protein n=1 Tax=Bacillus marinisedimentorum TaxID=1821260 RepID=UPI0007DEE505|nr:hypothetical protein [Bacillus marinisedimentorum]